MSQFRGDPGGPALAQPALPLPPRNVAEKVTCYHCWTKHECEDLLWIAEHEELRGDPVLGEYDMLRFLPSRFDVNGNAIDPRGEICRRLACPNCHLELSQALLERKEIVVTTAGAPSAGKSFFLGALATSLRRMLPEFFGVHVSDASPEGNTEINQYEDLMFNHPQGDQHVMLADLIPKTQASAEPRMRREVGMGKQRTMLVSPFSFLLDRRIPGMASTADWRRLLCLYDNAGEDFLPNVQQHVMTRHLVESPFIQFLFDPTLDSRWRRAQAKAGGQQKNGRDLRYWEGRQEQLLHEMSQRIRDLAPPPPGQRYRRPLMLVLTKLDEWREMLPRGKWKLEVEREGVATPNPFAAFPHEQVLENSAKLRELLRRTIPEIVHAAENFWEHVYYFACSSLGASPRRNPEGPSIRPNKIVPFGVVTPMLLGLFLEQIGNRS